MNSWECDHAGCSSSAVGVGGAIGLRAIGWHFKPGPEADKLGPGLLCPLHRPASPLATAEIFARRIQEDVVLTSNAGEFS